MNPAAPVTRIFKLPPPFLVCAFRLHNLPEGLEYDYQIKPDRPALDVEHIHLNSFLICCRLSAHHLPESGEPSLHGQQSAQLGRVTLTFFPANCPGTNEGKVTLQDAIELRKLIQTVLSQET